MQRNVRLQPRRNREDVARVLRRLISTGEMPVGERVNEVRLSERLGVSRTPIREALIGLEHAGWVHSEPNKGARVVPADEQLVTEVYPILAALEAEALQLSGGRLVAAKDELVQLNSRLRQEHRPAQQHALDSAFHRRLVRDCGNRKLLALIDTQWALARRFDGAFERGTANHRGTCEQHEQITEEIGANRLPRAAELLRQHWHQGIEVVRTWLSSRT